MRRYTSCKSCHSRIYLKKGAETRLEFEKQYGKTIEVQCRRCNEINSFSIREIKVRSRFIPIVAFLILIGGFYLSFKYLFDLSFGNVGGHGNFLLLPAGLIISGMVFITMITSEQKRIKSFNRS